ncbi:MAG TPA: NHL repeat-containing protein [Planctomycetota bacterium]
MKALWILIAVLSVGACGVLGWLISKKQKTGVKMKAMPRTEAGDMIEALQKVDPKLVIRIEAGRLPTGLRELRGVAVGPEDRIYVVGDKTLVVLDAAGKTLARTALDDAPRCVAVDGESTSYVGMRDHVQVVDAQGAVKAKWSVIDKDAWVTSVQVTADTVYVGDFGRRVVLKYDKAGTPTGQITPADGANGRFEIPSPFFDVALDAAGDPWVTHTGRRLIEHYKDGKLVTAWGKSIPQIEGFSGCCNPTHIAIRKDGTFVTSEKGLVRIKIHKPDGELVGVVAAPKDFRSNTKGLDLAVDSADRILVTDPDSSSIRVYVAKP